MAWAKYGFGLSVVAHVAAYFGMQSVKEPKQETQVAVMMSQQKRKEKPKPLDPPKPIEAPKETLRRPLSRPAAPAPAAPPPAAADPVAAAHPALANMPDFGISMTGGGLAAGGIAVPMGAPRLAGTPAVAAPIKEKVLGGSGPKAAVAEEGELVKAKPSNFIQPTYTDDARAAGIEGRVRLQLTIDASGNVTDAKVLAGLGHGLDEAAVAAAKRMHFTPASRGGVAVESTFVLSMRFVLGE